MNESVYFTDISDPAAPEAWTWAQDGETIRKLFIVQITFLIPLICCMTFGIMGATAGMVAGMHADHY